MSASRALHPQFSRAILLQKGLAVKLVKGTVLCYSAGDSQSRGARMRPAVSHWQQPHAVSVQDARVLQTQLAGKVVRAPALAPTRIAAVAGVDVGFRGDTARAAVVVLGFPGLELVDYTLAEVEVAFPYVPGLLAFREGPAVLAAMERLRTWPDVLIFDAHGLAHPRRLGLASHLGVILDWPSIGCAKSLLFGRADEPGNRQGDWKPVLDGEETIGAAVRTRPGVRPVYVSIGHRVDLPTAIDLVLRCTLGYRLPETTRYAHKVAGGAKFPIRPVQQKPD